MTLLEDGLGARQYGTGLREADDLSGVARAALTHIDSPGVATRVASTAHRRTTRALRRPQRLQSARRQEPRLICTHTRAYAPRFKVRSHRMRYGVGAALPHGTATHLKLCVDMRCRADRRAAPCRNAAHRIRCKRTFTHSQSPAAVCYVIISLPAVWLGGVTVRRLTCDWFDLYR